MENCSQPLKIRNFIYWISNEQSFITDFKFSRWLVINVNSGNKKIKNNIHVNSVLGFILGVTVGDDDDVSEVHATSNPGIDHGFICG